jgi:hypothetical protein
MSESPSERRLRLSTMLSDDGGTWDLSRNDKLAIKHAIELIHLLADWIAEQTGEAIPSVIERIERKIEAKL